MVVAHEEARENPGAADACEMQEQEQIDADSACDRWCEATVARILEPLGDGLRELAKREARLQAFYDDISSSESATHFTDNERHTTRQTLVQVQSCIQHMRSELQARLLLYETDIVSIENKLDARRGIIAAADETLADHSSVMEAVVSEEAGLLSKLRKAKARLREPINLVSCDAIRAGEAETKGPL